MPSELNARLQRLSSLHFLLAEARAKGEPGVPTKELLQEMDCDRTTLYRHRRELEDMTAPIRYDPKANLWAYTDDWNPTWIWCRVVPGAPGLRLSMSFLLDPELERDLSGSVLPARGAKGSAATLPQLTGIVHPSVLPAVSQALRECRELAFQYVKPGKDPEAKRVRPISLFAWDGMLYLQASAASDPVGAIKRYALSRMSKPRVLPESFQPPPVREVPSCLGAFTGPVIQATFQVIADLAPYVRERKWHTDQKIRDLPGGSLEFTLPFGDVGEAARWILGRGPGFAPVAPKKLVEAWKSMVQELSRQAAKVPVSPPRSAPR